MSDSEKKRLADAAADDRAPAFPGDCADTFDALPKAAPDEFGSWAKGKTQTLRDVFPTPEAFKVAADRFAQTMPHAGCIDAVLTARGPRFVGVLTEDGVAMVDTVALEAEFARAIEEMKR